MKQKCKIILFSLFVILLSAVYSCQKKAIEDISPSKLVSSSSLKQKMVTSSAEKQILIDWLNLHDNGLKDTEKKILEEITSNLDYGSLSVENRKNGENIIVIPINNSVKTQLNSHANYLKLDRKSILNLIIVQNSTGKLRWSSIISYLPEDGMNQSQLSKKTVQNVINGERVSDDGIYKFIDLKGNLKYQIKYKNGKLYSFGKPVREDLTKANKSKNTAARGGCTAWYLVTTYYYDDGSTSQTEEYLFTTCDQDTDEGGGGGGGGGGDGENPQDPQDPEEPNDQEITVSGSFDTFENDYQPEDYPLPVETDVPGEMDLDENGNPYPPVAFPTPVTYSHTWLYTRNAIGPFYIKAVYMNDATVHPANLQYQTNLGLMTRNIVLFDQIKSSTINGETAQLTWSYYVNTRWTNSTTNVTKVTQRRKSYPKTIPF
jgi:hypothetical protein